MAKDLNKVLLKAYKQFKDSKNESPIPIPEIKRYLERNGVSLENDDKNMSKISRGGDKK